MNTLLKMAFAIGLLWSSSVEAQTYGFNTHNARLTVIQPITKDPKLSTQLICMALNIYHEARGSSEANQLAVGLVTMNRHRTTKKSICSVVYERRGRAAQFSWTIMPRIKSRLLELEAWDKSQIIAHRVMFEQVKDITRGAHHFHEKTMLPRWSRGARQRIVIGAHVFVKLEEVAEARAVILP